MKKILLFMFAIVVTFISYAQNIQLEDSALLTRERWRDSIFRMDKSVIPTGFLYDYSMFGFESSKWDGTGNDDDTAKEEGQVFGLHNILWHSKVNSNAVIDVTDSLFKKAFFDNRNNNTVPLLFIYRQYNRIRQSSLSEGLFSIAADSVGILDVAGRTNSPYDTYELFAFSPFKNKITQFNAIAFTLPDELFYMQGFTSVEVDFGDGAGFRTLSKGSSVNIYYATEGLKYLTARITTSNGTRTAKSMIDYKRPATFSQPDYTQTFEADPVYLDDNEYIGGSGARVNTIPACDGGGLIEQFLCSLKPAARIEVENGCDHVFDKPIIIVEGFDPEGTLDINELRTRFSKQNFIATMQGYGYDFVYVDFTKNTTYIENNAKVLEAVINWVNQNKTGNFNSTVIGFSMGGLIARWCLKDMEDRGLQHHVENYFSYDAPHQGANIPLGPQYIFKEIQRDLPYLKFVKSFRSISDAYDSPAARQMLVTKGSYNNGPLNVTPNLNTLDPLRAAFAQRLIAKGYPQQTRNFGIAFGRGDNTASTKDAGNGIQWNNFTPGSRILKANVTWFLVNFQSSGYAVPENGINDYIARYRFEGLTFRGIFGINILPRITIRVRNFKYTGLNPYDDAPGGFELTQSIFASQVSGLANGIAKDATTDGHDGHAFVPSVSALDLQNQSYGSGNNWQSNNLFFNIDNQVQNAGLVNGNTLINSALSPFQAVITSTTEVPFFDFNIYHNGDISFQFARFIERNIINAQPINCAGSNGLCNSNPSISGPDVICVNGQYQISGVPAGVTIVWQIQNGNLVINNGQGTRIINVSRQNDGAEVVTATLTNTCGASVVLTKHITVGSPNFTASISGTNEAQPNGGYYFGLQFNPWNTLVSNINWTVPSGWTLFSGQGTAFATIYSGTTAGYVEATFDDACGTSHYVSKYVTIGSGGDQPLSVAPAGISIFPNPGNTVVMVALPDINDKRNNTYIRQINIVNKMGFTEQTLMFSNKEKKQLIDISRLKPDIYTIQVYNNKIWQSAKLIKD